MATVKDKINEILSESFCTVKARRDACRVHNDSYHILMSIHENGEQSTILEAAKQLAERENISFLEATTKVGNHIEGIVRSASGSGYGKSVRDAQRDS